MFCAVSERVSSLFVIVNDIQRKREKKNFLSKRRNQCIQLNILRVANMSSDKSWPDLVGKPVDEAVATIQNENPSRKKQMI